MHPERMCRPRVVCNVQNNSVTILALHLLYHQIFLDTEGMASFEREDGQSTNIVSLAGLLSSLLIYIQPAGNL